MKVTRARRIAFDVLRRVEVEGAYAADLLHARLEELGGASKTPRLGAGRDRDAALATELTLGVLRWRRLLDFLLERYLGKPANRLDLEVLLALRLGLYQLRWLERVPARAAVNESVELVKSARKSSAAGLVNAVLRRAASDAGKPVEKLLRVDVPTAERLGILYSHPTWIVARWLEFFGAARSVGLLACNNRAPRLACAVHDAAPSNTKVEEAAAALRRAGLTVEPGSLLRSSLTLRGGNAAETEAFRRGAISIQDEASQAIALLVGVEKGQSVLDLCAAPGGKTVTLERAAGANALVVAADRHLHRLRAMRATLERVGATPVDLLALDATLPLPLGTDFARILVDAPCAGTGTLARNPEIRWRLCPEDLDDFHRRQVLLLGYALDRLAPGGRLVYSTCSLEPEENEGVVTEVLANRRGFRRESGVTLAKELAPHLAAGVSPASLFDAEGFFRTFPPEHRTDGFFACAMERPIG